MQPLCFHAIVSVAAGADGAVAVHRRVCVCQHRRARHIERYAGGEHLNTRQRRHCDSHTPLLLYVPTVLGSQWSACLAELQFVLVVNIRCDVDTHLRFQCSSRRMQTLLATLP